MPIRQLAPDIAAKIAAGEVIERPASVVKELVENALDAGARRIRIEIAGGGLNLIRVTDDGCGIPADELPLALARHATSKVASLDDLERVATLGFRGEALASVAAVSRVSILSRPKHSDSGAQVTCEEGSLGGVSPAATPTGTIVAVHDLFASVPARLKFLKTRSTETGHAILVAERYAMAYPEVRFTFLSEGRQAFASSGDGTLFSALAAVYGLSVAEAMVAIPNGEEALHAGEQRLHMAGPWVSGYVSRPSCYKSTRQHLSFFVNRRWVQSRTLTFAVEEAYHSLLLAGRHPIAALNITLDPAMLDANVHPTKTEVRFLHERQVYAAVQRAVREAVLATAEAPDIAASAFGVPSWTTGDGTVVGGRGAQDAQARPLLWNASRSTKAEPASSGAAQDSPIPLEAPPEGFSVPGVDAAAPVAGAKLPVLRVLGQVSQSYIITEGPDGVYMVDQHAAHERILLERMIAQWRTREVSAQLLLQPVPVELSPGEREAIEDHLEALRAIGFEIEPFGDDTMLVRALPAALATTTRPQSLRELLVELAGADAEAARHGETWEEHALANVACKAAIKAGQSLSPQEQRELIRQLEDTSAHASCCHGRPTMVHLSLSALERQFDRR